MLSDDYGVLSDEMLVGLIRQGDQKAFGFIYQRYSAPLYVHACNFIGDSDEAKDVLQKVFIKIWDFRAQLPDKINLRAYLYQTVKNVLINHIARSKSAGKYLDSLSVYASSYVADTDYHIREKQLQEIIQREIQKLPPKMREIFQLSRTYHLTHREISEKLGVSEKTVKNQMTNALKILRSRLPQLVFLITFLQTRQ